MPEQTLQTADLVAIQDIERLNDVVLVQTPTSTTVLHHPAAQRHHILDGLRHILNRRRPAVVE